MGKLRFVAVAGAAAAVVLSGCTGSQGNGNPTVHKSPTSAASASASKETSGRSEQIPGETVTKAPDPIDGKAVARVANARGNREIDIPGGIKAGALSISVNCQGRGTLTVLVKPVGMSFPLECVAGEVSSTYNELHLKTARGRGTVYVTAPSPVRWALTVGR
ncbi:hypothetical protein ACFYS7_31845 [Streptomyces avermitilis]|uniref:hypothetical protein n=1 Tax=Streptomyces avermitilis TaxID=33903 RepID=UPI00339FAD86